MTGEHLADRLEELFRLACSGEPDAFAEWMGMVEIPLRRNLRRFSRAVDVEVVVQETFVRMWLVASDPRRRLEGNDASIRFAYRVARNVALEEIRRHRQNRFVDIEKLEGLPEGRIDPEPPDPALGRAIRECMEHLPSKPRMALRARIQGGHLPNKELADTLRMKLNSFFQNIVRARRLLADCMERQGVSIRGLLS